MGQGRTLRRRVRSASGTCWWLRDRRTRRHAPSWGPARRARPRPPMAAADRTALVAGSGRRARLPIPRPGWNDTFGFVAPVMPRRTVHPLALPRAVARRRGRRRCSVRSARSSCRRSTPPTRAGRSSPAQVAAAEAATRSDGRRGRRDGLDRRPDRDRHAARRGRRRARVGAQSIPGPRRGRAGGARRGRGRPTPSSTGRRRPRAWSASPPPTRLGRRRDGRRACVWIRLDADGVVATRPGTDVHRRRRARAPTSPVTW